MDIAGEGGGGGGWLSVVNTLYIVSITVGLPPFDSVSSTSETIYPSAREHIQCNLDIKARISIALDSHLESIGKFE